jgi:hypothetical protein
MLKKDIKKECLPRKGADRIGRECIAFSGHVSLVL